MQILGPNVSTSLPQILFGPALQMLGPFGPLVVRSGKVWWLYSELEVTAIRFSAVEERPLIRLARSEVSSTSVSSVGLRSVIQFESVEVIKWQRA